MKLWVRITITFGVPLAAIVGGYMVLEAIGAPMPILMLGGLAVGYLSALWIDVWVSGGGV